MFRALTHLDREFDATAERYDLMVGLNPGYHEHLRSAADVLAAALPTDRPARVVDLGCGSGASTVALVDAVDGDLDVVGIDASNGMLDVARRKSWPPTTRFAHGTAEELGAWAADGRVITPLDGVFACYLFRNVDDRDHVLRDVHSSLAPGGTLVVQEYSVAGSRRAQALWTFVCWAVVIPLSLVLTRRTTLYRYLWRSVLRFDTVERFTERLTRVGFVDVTVATVPGWQAGILHTISARRPEAA